MNINENIFNAICKMVGGLRPDEEKSELSINICSQTDFNNACDQILNEAGNISGTEYIESCLEGLEKSDFWLIYFLEFKSEFNNADEKIKVHIERIKNGLLNLLVALFLDKHQNTKRKILKQFIDCFHSRLEVERKKFQHLQEN